MRTAFLSFTLGTAIRFIGIVILICIVLWYVQFQARSFLQGPTLVLEEKEVVQHERSIILAGKTSNIVRLTLNGREIYTNREGSFTQTLVLEDGYTIMKLEAHDRFGRNTSLLRSYVYVPPPSGEGTTYQ